MSNLGYSAPRNYSIQARNGNKGGDWPLSGRPTLLTVNCLRLRLPCGRFRFFSFRFNRLRRPLGLDFNATGLCLFTLGQRYAQNTVLVLGTRSFGGYRVGQRERTSEASVSSLDP